MTSPFGWLSASSERGRVDGGVDKKGLRRGGEGRSEALLQARQTMNRASYASFLAAKRQLVINHGIAVDAQAIHPMLYSFQRDIVRWAVRKGRAAIFADCGLGKTFMQLEWARLSGKRSLIIAPLAVAQQTIREGEKLGLDVNYCREQGGVKDGLNITNYEMIECFDPSAFGAVVLDESSILKSIAGKTKAKLITMFKDTDMRLCCTATPAPNDIAEFANHSEFLGILPRPEMLATFFVHDDKGWRLKGHAEEPFYRWMASWGMSLRRPSDLGYSDDGYILPPLNILPVFIESAYRPEGMLFNIGLKGIVHRSQVRRATLITRIEEAARLINANDEQWIAWCGLNEEGRKLHTAVRDSLLIEGQQSPEQKTEAIIAFTKGEARVLITKPRIAGFGMNFQNASRMVFVGLGDSYEQYYHCIRRAWRFGQTDPVEAHIVLSDVEEPIYQNILRKERQADRAARNLIGQVSQFEKTEIQSKEVEGWQYMEDDKQGKNWQLLLGDSVERMKELEESSVDLSIFSPPFLSLYTYTATERDLGNSRTQQEFFEHFGFIIDELLRVTKAGRNACVHVAQVPARLVNDGYIGLKDFRGATIAAFEERGWIYHGEVCIDKDPQAQAIRTHSKGLLFAQLRKDASWLRPGLADYILVFRKPGSNTTPIQPEITNDLWIEWARPVWYGIRESDTLHVVEARGDKDERHICPLQLETIRRCLLLWSNSGDVVLSPFAGIGSEGYQAILEKRRFIGIELKPEYYDVALRNLDDAERRANAPNLFNWREQLEKAADVVKEAAGEMRQDRDS